MDAFLQLEVPLSYSHQQVSLARSPPIKNEDGVCVGLLLTSYDRTLVGKEISSEEVEEMHNILSEYHQVGLGKFTEESKHLIHEGPFFCNSQKDNPGCYRNICHRFRFWRFSSALDWGAFIFHSWLITNGCNIKYPTNTDVSLHCTSSESSQHFEYQELEIVTLNHLY